MGRQRSVGEVGLPQVVPQSALYVKNPPDQSKAQIQPKHRPWRAPRNRWKKPIAENNHFPPPHEPWTKEDWEKIRKFSENQKENHYLHCHGKGDLGGAQSQAGGPTEPPKVQHHRHRWPRCRRRPRKSYFKWRKWKVAEVEEDLPLPPVCEHERVEHEDWDRELSEQAGGDQEDDCSGAFSIEDVLTVALMKLSVGPGTNGRVLSLYNPSIHHMPPVKWESGSRGTVEGQFSDAEE